MSLAIDELQRLLLKRTGLGQRLVLFRTLAGVPVALDDRCAHRSFHCRPVRSTATRSSAGTMENLLDLTHLSFVHANSFSTP